MSSFGRDFRTSALIPSPLNWCGTAISFPGAARARPGSLPSPAFTLRQRLSREPETIVVRGHTRVRVPQQDGPKSANVD